MLQTRRTYGSISSGNWCGDGIYFYDIKSKAWWAAGRKVNQLKQISGEKLKEKVILADIKNINKKDIFDARSYKDMQDFEEFVKVMLEDYQLAIQDGSHDMEETIIFRSMLINFYTNYENKKLVIGNFKQRPQAKHKHIIEFSASLDMAFGIETIFCVKDTNIIDNIRMGGQ